MPFDGQISLITFRLKLATAGFAVPVACVEFILAAPREVGAAVKAVGACVTSAVPAPLKSLCDAGSPKAVAFMHRSVPRVPFCVAAGVRGAES